MEPIEGKTKISTWAINGEKEVLVFDLFDFSPEQVGDIERLIRHPDDKVALSLEPQQKKLQIDAITSPVRLVSMALRSGGQKLKVADFKSPDSRAEAMKRLTTAETPVLVTIKQLQQSLLDTPTPAASAAATDDAANVLDIKIPRTFRAQIRIKLHPVQIGGLGDPDGWHVTAAVLIPNHDEILRGPVMVAKPPTAYDTPGVALAVIETLILIWLSAADRAKYPYGRKLAALVTKQVNARIAELEPEVD